MAYLEKSNSRFASLPFNAMHPVRHYLSRVAIEAVQKITLQRAVKLAHCPLSSLPHDDDDGVAGGGGGHLPAAAPPAATTFPRTCG